MKYGITPNVGANIAIFSERSTSRCTKLRGLPPNGGLIDQKKNGGYATPIESAGSFLTYISRIREDKTKKNTINMWIVSDNLLRGAALNAVEIAELLIKKNYG